MKVHLKCFASLAKEDICDYEGSTEYEISKGETVGSLIDRIGMKSADIKIIFVNGQKSSLETVLREGDRLGLAPATGGM
jgi:hypothetical protein